MKLSPRLGKVTGHQLQEAANRFDLGKILAVEPLTSGLFGQNVLVTVRGPDRWVFRGAPHWPWQFDKERFFVAALAQSTQAPVPWPYYVDDETELFGWPYAWLKWLPGSPPDESSLSGSGDNAVALAVAIAEVLAELHRLQFPSVGEYDPETGGIAAESSFAEWFLRSLDGWIARVEEVPGALDQADRRLMAELREDAADALNEPLCPQFTRIRRIACHNMTNQVFVPYLQGCILTEYVEIYRLSCC